MLDRSAVNANVGALLNSAASDDEDGDDQKGSVLGQKDFYAAVLTIANAALGAGLLSIPYAFASAGLVGGGVALLALMSLSCASLCTILGHMARAQAADRSVTSYGALVGWCCGPRASWLVEVLVITNSFGSCIGYLVLCGDVFTPLLPPALGVSRTAVSAAAAVVCLLLSLLRRISALRYSAGVAVFSCFFTAGMLVWHAAVRPCRLGACDDETGRHGWCTHAQAAAPGAQCNAEAPTAGVSAWPLAGLRAHAFLRALPLLINAMQCHIQAAFVFAELPAGRLRRRAPRRAIAATASALLLGFYAAVGAAGYARFGAATQGDCLQNFGEQDLSASVARVAVGVTALCAYPMQHFPARAVLHRLWRAVGAARAERMSAPFVLLEAPLWVAVTLLLAVVVGSDLAFVFELLGALVVAAVVFLVPAALLRSRRAAPSRRARGPAALAAAFVVVGLCLTVSGTYISIADELAKPAWPEKK